MTSVSEFLLARPYPKAGFSTVPERYIYTLQKTVKAPVLDLPRVALLLVPSVSPEDIRRAQPGMPPTNDPTRLLLLGYVCPCPNSVKTFVI